MYFTSNENWNSWWCWLPLQNLSHCYRSPLILGTVWSHNSTQVWDMHIKITGITTLVFLVLYLVKKMSQLNTSLSFVKWVSLDYISGVSWPPIPKDILELNHGRVFRGKFRSVYVMKCVWSLFTDLLFNRLVFLVSIWDKLVSAPIGTTCLKMCNLQQFRRLIFYPCDRWFIYIHTINYFYK